MTFSQSNKNFDYENLSDPDAKNKLSIYFKKEILKKLLRKANFQPKKNNIVLSFDINNENKAYGTVSNNKKTENKYQIGNS